MFKHGEYILMKDGRIARIENVYDGIPDLYIVCYVNWGGLITYAKESDLLAGTRMTKQEYKNRG